MIQEKTVTDSEDITTACVLKHPIVGLSYCHYILVNCSSNMFLPASMLLPDVDHLER